MWQCPGAGGHGCIKCALGERMGTEEPPGHNHFHPELTADPRQQCISRNGHTDEVMPSLEKNKQTTL